MFIQVLITEQRYKFESNSQPDGIVAHCSVGCLLQSKDTNLKAIHNVAEDVPLAKHGAYYRAKIQI